MSSRLFVQNLPKKITEKELREHFSKFGDISDLKLVTRDQTNRRFCFVGFKTNEAAKKTLEYFNKTYIMTSKITVDFAKTKDDPSFNPNSNAKPIQKKKEKGKKISNSEMYDGIEESKKRKFQELISLMKTKEGISWDDSLKVQEEDSTKKHKKSTHSEEDPEKSNPKPVEERTPTEIGKRLFVLNLAYDSTEEDVKSIFQPFGNITDLKMPLDKEKKFRGFAYVTFETENEALRCFSELDNRIVQGRILHLKPADEKPNANYQEREIQEKSSFKKFSKERRLAKLNDTRSWNTLFLNPNAIVNEICSRFEVKKVDLFSVEQENLAAKIAIAESKLIGETIEWMKVQGMDISFIETERDKAERSKKVIIVKNLHTKTNPSTLSELFSRYGKVEKALVAPNGAIGVVVMESEEHAENAFKNLSYYVFKHEPLYLEYAPLGMVEELTPVTTKILEEEVDETNSRILFLKNINFSTTEEAIKSEFEAFGEIMKVKIPRDNEGKSRGFGFIEFRERESASEALKKKQNVIIDSHCLQLSVSTPKEKPKSKNKRKEKYEASSKLLIKNLAFEATKKELTELLKQFGELKSVRIPKKLDNTHRGFAFAEFSSLEDAKTAFAGLLATHFYGRKLVVEYAKGE